jgi:hypothetical protein
MNHRAGKRREEMKLKLRALLLGCLVAGAIYTGLKAYRSIVPGESSVSSRVYAELTMDDSKAKYYLKPSEGYIGVYSGKRDKTPVSVTKIEIAGLRGTDRELLQKGIPAASYTDLLQLLEDLGS